MSIHKAIATLNGKRSKDRQINPDCPHVPTDDPDREKLEATLRDAASKQEPKPRWWKGDWPNIRSVNDLREYLETRRAIVLECAAGDGHLPENVDAACKLARQAIDNAIEILHQLTGTRPARAERQSTPGELSDALAALVDATLPDKPDRKPDSEKKGKKTVRPMTTQAPACIRTYKRRRKNGEKASMKAIVDEYTDEHGGSAISILRILSDHPDEWKTRQEHDSSL